MNRLWTNKAHRASLASQMCIVCLHLIEQFLKKRFVIGVICGVFSTFLFNYFSNASKLPVFRADQSKFEYENNQRLIDNNNNNLFQSSSWNNSWDGLERKTSWERNLYLIRHGKYFDNVSTLEQMKLTSLGREQLAYTGKRLKELNIEFDRLIHSGMVRAFESATIINEQLSSKLQLIEDKNLTEGLPVAPVPYVGISQKDVNLYGDRNRIDTAFKTYFHRSRYDQKKTTHDIIVFHANVLRYFICKILQFPVEGWLRLSLNHGSITHVTILSDGTTIVKVIGDSGFIPVTKITF